MGAGERDRDFIAHFALAPGGGEREMVRMSFERRLGADMSEDDIVPTFEEAMRLTIAFYCIMEPEKREVVRALVEKYANRSRLQEAAAEPTFDKVESRPPVPRRVELLARQREYARHLASLQFLVIESAVEQMGGHCAESKIQS